jgi:hypothetical protein
MNNPNATSSGADGRKDNRAAGLLPAKSQAPVEGTPLAISPQQQVAIEQLVAGKSLVASATSAGVSRLTLYRWLKSDPVFTAAYNAWQREMLETAKARLVALTDGAVTAVGEAMVKGDAKTAMTLLKSLGLLQPVKPGPTELDEVKWEQGQEERKKKSRKFEEEMRLLPGD